MLILTVDRAKFALFTGKKVIAQVPMAFHGWLTKVVNFYPMR